MWARFFLWKAIPLLLLASVVCHVLPQNLITPFFELRASSLAQDSQTPSTTHSNSMHHIRDFVWTDTDANAKSQNLCGLSTFAKSALDTADNENEDGSDDTNTSMVSTDDCRQFAETMQQRNGYWLVTGFSGGAGGGLADWEEFATLASCKMGVRRWNGGTQVVPIGNQDVVDILYSVIEKFSEGNVLPPTQGNMTCYKSSTIAEVEWRVYND